MDFILTFIFLNQYMCVYVMNEVQPRVKTKVMKKTLSPQWNEMLEVFVLQKNNNHAND